MKAVIICILFVTTLLFGGLYWNEVHKAGQMQASAEALRQSVSELQSSLAEQEGRTKQMHGQLQEARAETTATIQENARLNAAVRESLTNQALAAQAKAAAQTKSKSSNPMAPLAEMFKNPEMKDMIKTQQKNVLGPMIEKNYGKLFADLRLTPEQATTLKDMLLNKQLAAAEQGMSMISGETDGAKREELTKQIKTANDAADAQLKQFLGEDNFAQLQAYDKTMGERMVVTGLKDQLASGPTALADPQEQQLIDAMGQERASFKFTTDLSDKSKFNEDFASMFTEDKMNTYFQELGKLDEQYMTRAQAILSPDQLTAFGKYLNSQQAMQKAGMQMAVKMFGPAKEGGQ